MSSETSASSNSGVQSTVQVSPNLPSAFKLPVVNKVVIVVSIFFSAGGVLTAIFIFPQGTLFFWILIGCGGGSFATFSAAAIYSCVQWRNFKKISKLPAIILNVAPPNPALPPQNPSPSSNNSNHQNNSEGSPSQVVEETPVMTDTSSTASSGHRNTEDLPLQDSLEEEGARRAPVMIIVPPRRDGSIPPSPQSRKNDINRGSASGEITAAVNILTTNSQSKFLSASSAVNETPPTSLSATVVAPIPQTTSGAIKSGNGSKEEEPADSSQPPRVVKYASVALGKISNYFLSGGMIQKRAYQCLLYPIVDAMLLFFSHGQIKFDSLTPNDKITRIEECIRREAKEFEFLLTTYENRNNLKGLERCLWKAFYYLQKINNDNASNNRKKFNDYLQKAQETVDYKDNIEAFCEHAQKESFEGARKKYPNIALLITIANAMFTQVHLHTLADEAVFETLKIGYQKKNNHSFSHWTTTTKLKEALTEDFEAIHQTPTSHKSGGLLFTLLNKLKGHFNIWFEPLNTNNYISVLWKDVYIIDGKEHTVECLRFGTPTKETNNDPEILAQLHYFFNYSVLNNQVVVSFQHQNYKPKGSHSGNESSRLEKNLALNDHPRYKNHVYIFAFPMDNEFFNQTGRYADLSNIELFKKTFFTVIFGNNEGFYLPKDKLDRLNIEYLKDTKEIIDTVHRLFFPKDPKLKASDEQTLTKQTLTKDERIIFQLITYLFMEDYFVTALRGNYFNSQCKDDQDRGMVIKALHFYLRMIKLGREKDPEYLRQLRVLIHHAALFIKGAAMHGGRGELLKMVLDFLQKKEGIDSIRSIPINITHGKLVSKASLKNSFIEWMPNQSIHPLPYEADSFKEYEELIHSEREKEAYLPFDNFSSICFKGEPPKELSLGILHQYINDVERQEFMCNDHRLTLELASNSQESPYKLLNNIYYQNEIKKKFPDIATDSVIEKLMVYTSLEINNTDLKLAICNILAEEGIVIDDASLNRFSSAVCDNPFKEKKDIYSFKKELINLGLSEDVTQEIYKNYLSYGDIDYRFHAELGRILTEAGKSELNEKIKKIIKLLKVYEYFSYIYQNSGNNEALTAQLLCYSDQRTTKDMTAVMFQRYNITIVDKTVKPDGSYEIQTLQRISKKNENKPNTLSIVRFKNGKPTVEVRQMWQIGRTDEMDSQLFFFKSRIILEVDKEHAVMSWSPPEKENQELFVPLVEEDFTSLCTSQMDDSSFVNLVVSKQ